MKKLTFEEARTFVRSLNLNSFKDWKEYCKSGNKPNNIPGDPSKGYKNNGWINWGDWLGTFNVSNKNKQFISFEEAKETIKKLNLKSRKDYEKYQSDMIEKFKNTSIKNPPSGSGKTLPNNQVFGRIYRSLPSNPNVAYVGPWKGWNDFLGVKSNEFLPFEDARNFVRSLNLKNVRDWEEYRKLKPDNIPSLPKNIYNNDWISWGDWLGTNKIATKYLSAEEFKKFIQETFPNISQEEIREVYEKWWDENKPINMPRNAYKYYNK